MIISDEQARAAAQYLKANPAQGCDLHGCDVSPAIMQAARAAVDGAPDLRADRVAEARERMAGHALDSRDVADKMISRIVSDSLR